MAELTDLPTNVIPPLFIEMPMPSQKSKLLCIYVLELSILTVFL